MFRITLLIGPPLAFLAWWWVQRIGPEVATQALLWRLLVASLIVPFICVPHLALLWHPRWGRALLPKWEIWKAGLMVKNGVLVPWRDLSSFRVESGAGEPAGSEIVLHVNRTFRGKVSPLSLPCLKTEVDPLLIDQLARAIENMHWTPSAPEQKR